MDYSTLAARMRRWPRVRALRVAGRPEIGRRRPFQALRPSPSPAAPPGGARRAGRAAAPPVRGRAARSATCHTGGRSGPPIAELSGLRSARTARRRGPWARFGPPGRPQPRPRPAERPSGAHASAAGTRAPCRDWPCSVAARPLPASSSRCCARYSTLAAVPTPPAPCRDWPCSTQWRGLVSLQQSVATLNSKVRR